MRKFLFAASIALAVFAITAKANSEKLKVAYTLDFAKASGNPVAWLKNKGFEFQKDADDICLAFEKRALTLKSSEPLFGVIIKENLKLEGVKKIRLTWGIEKYPVGASYEKGVNNEALMIYVFFGTEKLSSNSWFIPNSPYFIGLFLAESDKANKMYIGKHFKAGGRFVCAGTPPAQKTITTEFDLSEAFKKYFKKSKVPFVSGISLEVDTSYLEQGKGAAFIKKIELLK